MNLTAGARMSALLGPPVLGPHEPWERWLARRLRADFDRWCDEHYPAVPGDRRDVMFAAFRAGYDQRGDEE